MSKRTLIILTIILLIIAIALFVLRVRNQSAPIVESPPTEESFIVVETENSALATISNRAITQYWVDPADRSIYVLTDRGEFFTMFPGGNERLLFNFVEGAVRSLELSLDGKYLLVEEGTTSRLFYTLEISTGNQQFLPLGTTAAVWSPNQIHELAFYKAPDAPQATIIPSGSLNILNVTTNKSRFLSNFRIIDPVLQWHTAGELLIASRASQKSSGSVWSYNIQSNTFTTLVNNRPGVVAAGAEDGDHILVFTSGTSPTLNLLERATGVEKNLGFVTLPEKCTFTATLIYCATPSNTFSSADFPDVYLQRAKYSIDDIIALNRVNPGIETVSLLFDSERDTTIDAISLKKVGDELYFINRYDNKLYALSL